MQHVDPRPQWRGQRDTSRGRLWRALAVSVGVHAPLTPIAALFGLFGLLGTPATVADAPAVAPITAIPIDLIDDDRGPAGAAPSEPPSEEPAATSVEPAEDPFAALDDEDDTKPPDPPEAEAPDAGSEPAVVDGGALAADGGAEAGAGPAVGDPIAMSGAAGKVTDQNANVRLLIYNERIRNHPLGSRVGVLLGAAQQWKDFFGPTGLDPIKDVDRILIAGPQLRDSTEVVAVLELGSDPKKVKAAIDGLVKRDPKGGWLDAGVPAARARADGAERVFVMTSKNIVVVAPPSAADHALTLGGKIKFPKPEGNEALSTYVVTPWRAFVGIPFPVPKSIAWVRMKITPTSDGGAVAVLVAEDATEQDAEKNAAELTRSINAVTQVKLGVIGAMFGKKEHRLIEPVTFTARGKQIHGTVVATPSQLGTLMNAISTYAEQLAKEAAAKDAAAKAKAAQDGGTPVAKPPASAAPAVSAAPPTPSASPDAG